MPSALFESEPGGEKRDDRRGQRRHGLGSQTRDQGCNGRVTHGNHVNKRGSKSTYDPAKKAVIVAIWKHSEQPGGTRLKQTLPLWIDSYQARRGRH